MQKFSSRRYLICPDCKRGKLDLQGHYRVCLQCKQVFEADRMKVVCAISDCTNNTAAIVKAEDGLWESRCRDHLELGAVMIQDDSPKKWKKPEPKPDCRKITEKQSQAIQHFGLNIPPTKRSATTLLSFLLDGNGTGGDDIQTRTAIAKRYEDQWLGKRVRGHYSSMNGTVMRLWARSIDEVADIRLNNKDQNIRVSPFTAYVCWDNGSWSRTSFSQLDLLEESAGQEKT